MLYFWFYGDGQVFGHFAAFHCFNTNLFQSMAKLINSWLSSSLPRNPDLVSMQKWKQLDWWRLDCLSGVHGSGGLRYHGRFSFHRFAIRSNQC